MAAEPVLAGTLRRGNVWAEVHRPPGEFEDVREMPAGGEVEPLAPAKRARPGRA